MHFTKGLREDGATPKNADLAPQFGEPMEGFIRSHACQTPEVVGVLLKHIPSEIIVLNNPKTFQDMLKAS